MVFRRKKRKRLDTDPESPELNLEMQSKGKIGGAEHVLKIESFPRCPALQGQALKTNNPSWQIRWKEIIESQRLGVKESQSPSGSFQPLFFQVLFLSSRTLPLESP